MCRAALLVVGCLAVAAGSQAPAEPLRVVDRVSGREISLDGLVARVSAADVLLIGDTPGHAAVHRAQARVLSALAAGRAIGPLVLEILDRQAQEPLDHFQMGHTSEEEFLAGVERPWSGYPSDYRGIVNLAITGEWGVVAGAMPRPLAAAVAIDGLDVVNGLPAAERSLVAGRHSCADVMAPGGASLPGPYSGVAVCLENETLAESIAQAHTAASIGGRSALVIAVVRNDRIGHLTRLAGDVTRRLPGRTVTALAIVETPDLSAVSIVPYDLAVPRLVIYTQQP